jgi:hypothetical protein
VNALECSRLHDVIMPLLCTHLVYVSSQHCHMMMANYAETCSAIIDNEY